jgi:pimeloyl-ACP methyl ester carboxylesterase
VRHRQSLRANPSVDEYEADRGRLRGFAPPVLLVKGIGSRPLLHQVIDELARQLPNAEVAEWPGGHAPHIVSMEPFLERLAAFQSSTG